jgi:legumain
MRVRASACVLLALAACAAAVPLERLIPSTPADGKVWALLVAGSDGYGNYRHQADVCHAFQLLKAHGIAEENIVTMMYDDIANNPQNPHKGTIVNEPAGEPDAGVNVYDGVVKDYTKGDVSPKNMLAVLRGDAAAMKGKGSGRVIASGPKDRVFVYFADHGGPGAIAFPQHLMVIQPLLHADQLISTLKTMHQNQQYAQMTIYIEACESGSMFNGLLPDDINVYAVTAATPYESSYACYYSSQYHTYLGDCFSNHWMENSDATGDLSKETLDQQFQRVAAATNTSTVCRYGDLSIAQEDVSLYQGATPVPAPSNALAGVPANPVPSRDASLAALRFRIEAENDLELKQRLEAELLKEQQNREHWDDLINRILRGVAGGDGRSYRRLAVPVTADPSSCTGKAVGRFDCFRSVVEQFNTKCSAFDDYGLSKLSALRRICDNGLEGRLPAVLAAEC